jgi:ParB family chromosome partitioning protein
VRRSPSVNDIGSSNKELEMKPRLDKIRVKKIRIRGKHRPLVSKQVKVIADSMSKIGLNTPITVRETSKGPVLITGQHRLAAAKSLGWRRIDCVVMKGDKIERQLWALAENLHRAELDRLQRAESVKKWQKLIRRRDGSRGVQSGGRQPRDKGISRTAKGLGITRDEVRRSTKIVGISPEARRAAKDAGLADNEKALLEVAREPKSLQVAKVDQLSKRKRKKKRVLSVDEINQVKTLNRAYEHAQQFKEAWKDASTPARQHFVKTVLNKADDVDEEDW